MSAALCVAIERGEVDGGSIRCFPCRLAALSLNEGDAHFVGRNGKRRIGIEDCCSFCLLDLLVFIAFGHMNVFGFALTCEERLWFDTE
eukprot:scaffold41719_cov66-Cyclotella_meneghiniana.AAC.1